MEGILGRLRVEFGARTLCKGTMWWVRSMSWDSVLRDCLGLGMPWFGHLHPAVTRVLWGSCDLWRYWCTSHLSAKYRLEFIWRLPPVAYLMGQDWVGSLGHERKHWWVSLDRSRPPGRLWLGHSLIWTFALRLGARVLCGWLWDDLVTALSGSTSMSFIDDLLVAKN